MIHFDSWKLYLRAHIPFFCVGHSFSRHFLCVIIFHYLTATRVFIILTYFF
jgi:hypothetical protein